MVGTDTAGKTLADLALRPPPRRRRRGPPVSSSSTTTRRLADSSPSASAAACSMHQRGSSRARRRRTLDRRDDLDASARMSSAATSASTSPAMITTRHAGHRGPLAHPADDLAVEALRVEVALAGDDDVGRGQRDRRARRAPPPARSPARAARRRPPAPGEPTGGAAALDLGDVDAVLVGVPLGELLEAGGEQPDLGRRGALLRGEHGGRVDEAGAHVARHLQLDGAQPGRGSAAPRAPRARRRWWPTRRGRRRSRRAPSLEGPAMSSPVPIVVACRTSLPSGPPASAGRWPGPSR